MVNEHTNIMKVHEYCIIESDNDKNLHSVFKV